MSMSPSQVRETYYKYGKDVRSVAELSVIEVCIREEEKREPPDQAYIAWLTDHVLNGPFLAPPSVVMEIPIPVECKPLDHTDLAHLNKYLSVCIEAAHAQCVRNQVLVLRMQAGSPDDPTTRLVLNMIREAGDLERRLNSLMAKLSCLLLHPKSETSS